MKLKLQTEPKLDLKMQSEPQFNLKATTAIVSKGTSNYNDLENKPSINGIELVGNVEITSVSEDAKNISANASSISNLKEEVSKKASQTELDALSSTVKTNTKSIETNTTDIASIKTDVSNKANKTDLDTTNKNVATNTSAIATETTARESADTTLQANIDTKQDTLISGTNIKTINNQSLLGSGNITIEGGGSTNTVVYETVSTLSALPSAGNLNTLYYVEDIKGYYIYTGEVYRSIDATAVQNNLNTLETTVKGKQDKFTVHESQSIEITSWELLSEAPSWCTDEPYMYRAKVSVSNITENTMILNIVLSDSILLNVGQVIETIDDGIYLYAKTDTALSGTLITLITCEVQNA